MLLQIAGGSANVVAPRTLSLNLKYNFFKTNIGDSLWSSAIEWWLKFGEAGLSKTCNFSFEPSENDFGVCFWF